MIEFIGSGELRKKRGIYKIVDSKSGRYYIGSTSGSFAKRLSHHNYRASRGDHPNKTLQSIFSKDNSRLKFYVIEVVEDASAIITKEQEHIDFSFKNGERRTLINELLVAGSHAGKKRSDETKQKISKALTGKVASDAAKEKMRNAKLGKKLSLEHREKLSLVRTGKKINRPTGILATWSRKYSEQQIRDMRQMKESGSSYTEIERLFDISHGGLQKIIQRITYRDVV